ncbi:hypothetical protein ABZ353_25310 [Streptomyces niveus]|uniref:hypothetical protein n=1 Tax=Streptomyces niveus TaxID=193462 RepID=UPI0033C4DC6D
MEIRPLAIGRQGIRADRTIGFFRTRQGIEDRQLADLATALSRTVTNTASCRIERTPRRPGIDDLAVIAGVPRVSPSAPLPEPTAP